MFRLKRSKQKTEPRDRRAAAISIIFMLMGFFIVARLFFLQIIEYPFYNALASGQHEIFKQLIPQRGEIFARTENGLYPLAVNRNSYIVYAVPTDVEDPEKAAEILLPWMEELKMRGIEEDEEEEIVDLVEAEQIENQEEVDNPELFALINILSKKQDPYEPLIKGATKDDIAVLKSYNIEGINWIPVASRYYPEKNIGSHTIGFYSSLSDDKKGQYGLEGYFDELLRGREGILHSEKDARGSQISIAPRTIHQARDGADLILTIDPAIQYTACTKLAEYVEHFKATGGSVVILNPDNGKILALCGYPDYDPNLYNKVESIDVFAHPAVNYTYEPGSVVKPLTMAAGLDSELVEPDDTYYDEGELKIGGFTIKNSDFKSHGTQTMVNILEKSLNTGAIYVAEKVGTKLFRKYMLDFGFGEKTGIELNGEASGNINSLDKKGLIYLATGSYGHGITVTPIQMATSFLPVANGGKLYKPYLVESIEYPDGKKEIIEPTEVRTVLENQTSALLSGMLVSVIKNGHATKAGVKGYLVAGKTGTANIAGPDGKYLKDTIHNFVGFAPVDNPRFVMLTKLDRPQTTFSSESAAPLFGEIADFILKYYHVPPTEVK